MPHLAVKSKIENIEARLTLLSERIKTYSKIGLNDAAKLLEPFAARLLNAVYGWQLKDPAPGSPTTRAIDLVDESDPNHRIAVQVSVQAPGKKSKHTRDVLTTEEIARYHTIAIFFFHHSAPRNDQKLTIINIPKLLGALAGKDPRELDKITALLDREIATLPEPGVSEDPGTILKLLRTHLPEVQSLWAAKVAVCTKANERIELASMLFGREPDLAKLRDMLRQHRRIAVTGPGGLGKTALCAELVRRLEHDSAPDGPALLSAGLFAHDFYRAPSLAAFVSSILQQAGLVCENPLHQPALAALVLRRPGVLLYIEGAEKLTAAAALLDFLDEHTGLILTTRDPRQAESLPSHPLEPLQPADAAAALHHYAASKPRTARQGEWPYPAESPGWALLARDLDGHALACRLAGELCARHTLDPATLHQQLVQHGLHPLLPGEREAEKQNSKKNLNLLFRQSALAVEQACPGNADQPSPALVAWHALTLGGTSPVPFSILQAFGVVEMTDIDPLMELGLVWSRPVAAEQDGKHEPGYALTHALLGEWARTGLEEFGCPADGLLVRAMQWGEEFRNVVQRNARVPGGPERYLVLVPVAEALLREVETLPELEPDRLYTFYYLPARMHDLHARHLAAEAIYRPGLERMEAAAGPGAPATAIALNNLALLLQDTNRLAEAEPLLRRALAIDETSLGSNHYHVAIRLNNLALLLHATNRLAEAEPLMRRALAIDESSFGSVHPDVARDLNNLFGLLLATNRLTEAEPLIRRALAIDEASYGSVHPNVARDLNNLARLLQLTNRLAEAEPLMRRALAIDEASFGSVHPNVARDLNNLASLFYATNRLAEAEPLMRRALAIDEASFGSVHPNVAVRLNNLSKLLQATNRLAEAEPLLQRTVAIDEASFGRDHPEVATGISNLARLLQATKRPAEAEPLMRRVVEIFVVFTATTGYRHPNLVEAASNYAGLLMAMGETVEQAVEKTHAILAPVRDKLPES